MTQPQPICEAWRGPLLESQHLGHIVVCDGSGQVVQAIGDPEAVIFPRSSCKMIQALPLVTSGAADAQGLSETRLALACASHSGAPLHVAEVKRWLADLGLGDDDLRCGTEPSRDKALRFEMIRDGQKPCQVHNNCSGKHAGFLTLSQHLGAGADYVDPDHPVQTACRDAFEEVTGMTSPGFGIDGCSAPNFATSMHALARSMAFFATAHSRNDPLSRAAARLAAAMRAWPEHVAGKGRACTLLMRAAKEPLVAKTGAEGVFIAILPGRGMGIAVKAADGATRAAECAIAATLVQMDVLDADHPDVVSFMTPTLLNRRGLEVGFIRPPHTLFPA
ncbi:asparaginase [Primorskyibacter marinus]|uniref:asparaginase n=1 Tax=Primorskyibacter marinus TaxID=1977320 RepID=UPI000E303DA6|nr:asparaginase [Primorskyibacter marinus]